MADLDALPQQWPTDDFTRIPYRLFRDEAVYRREQQRLFAGPHWNYLCIEAELPAPGDFLVSYVGERQVVVQRTEDGEITAFLNSCAHRGAQLVRCLRGNATSHTCAYHQWCFGTHGELIGVPQQRGVKGAGGMPKDFDKQSHGLRMLRVESYKGLIFATFSEEAPSIYDYLGPSIRPEIDRIFDRPVKVLGYYRQLVPANWKLYLENVKDPYHAGLLHLFHVTFGIYRPTMSGRVTMDSTKGHSILRTADIGEENAEVTSVYAGIDKYREDYRLNDPSLFDVAPDYDDRVTNMIMTIFPNLMLGQVANTFQTRHVRPKGLREFELYWTYLGFEGEDAEATEGKLRQSNFIGPAGYISLEDGEAGRLVQIGVDRRDPEDCSIVQMGGRGPIEDQDTLATEVALRGFWKHYAEAMDMPAAGIAT
ncbi:MAG TPA: Rieske 2Fe-2S domain-containing protein [Sphingopyxis sp.]|nr:Rieske 2Fe-2S domain-containing protein [Sphingopyxis sp.]HMP44531.1 Rieske 2Fe-2S domain-containing protein [Sphingopyxis sp.]